MRLPVVSCWQKKTFPQSNCYHWFFSSSMIYCNDSNACSCQLAYCRLKTHLTHALSQLVNTVSENPWEVWLPLFECCFSPVCMENTSTISLSYLLSLLYGKVWFVWSQRIAPFPKSYPTLTAPAGAAPPSLLAVSSQAQCKPAKVVGKAIAPAPVLESLLQ